MRRNLKNIDLFNILNFKKINKEQYYLVKIIVKLINLMNQKFLKFKLNKNYYDVFSYEKKNYNL